jgi:hypothetical protein
MRHSNAKTGPGNATPRRGSISRVGDVGVPSTNAPFTFVSILYYITTAAALQALSPFFAAFEQKMQKISRKKQIAFPVVFSPVTRSSRKAIIMKKTDAGVRNSHDRRTI